jgi:hypothetical protein
MERIIRDRRVFDSGKRDTQGRPLAVAVELEFNIERAWQVLGRRAARNSTGRAIVGNGSLRAIRKAVT